MPDRITVFLNKYDDDSESVVIYLLWNKPGELLCYMGYMGMCRGIGRGVATCTQIRNCVPENNN